MDKHSEEVMNAAIKEYFKDMSATVKRNVSAQFFETGGPLPEDSQQIIDEMIEDHEVFVAIERPSVGVNGKYNTMTARDISLDVAIIDQLIFNKKKKGTLIGIGDGGNEVGMGNVQDQVKAHVSKGDEIASATTCDYLLVADTSNYGAYALISAIQLELLGDTSD